MYGMTAIVPAWCHTEVYAPAMTLVTTTKATATRRRLDGVDADIVDAALTMDALTHGSKNRNSLWAASEYPKIVQNVTTNACGAARRFLKNPESAAGVIVPMTAGYPCVRYQCHGCAPYIALPPPNTLNRTKLHGTHVHSP